MVHEYWVENYHVSPNARDVLWRRITRNQYENHEKDILEMTWIELFNKFKEDHNEVDISINTFLKQKHAMLNLSLPMTLVVVIIMWNLSYILTLSLILLKCFGHIHLLLSQSMILYPKFYVKEKVMKYFTKKKCFWKFDLFSLEVSYWYEWPVTIQY